MHREGQEFENIEGPLVIQEYIQHVIRNMDDKARAEPLGCGEDLEETGWLRDKRLDLRARAAVFDRPECVDGVHEAALHGEDLSDNDGASRVVPLHNAQRGERRRRL